MWQMNTRIRWTSPEAETATYYKMLAWGPNRSRVISAQALQLSLPLHSSRRSPRRHPVSPRLATPSSRLATNARAAWNRRLCRHSSLASSGIDHTLQCLRALRRDILCAEKCCVNTGCGVEWGGEGQRTGHMFDRSSVVTDIYGRWTQWHRN